MEATTNFDDTRQILREIVQSQQETDRITKRNAKLIGDLGNKFGSFTEGMAFPSMERVLREQFGMTTVTTRYKAQRNGDTIEIDVLGLANGTVNAVVIVEVKSHLKEHDVEQMLRITERFYEFFPEHNGKKLYAVLAFVDGAYEVQKQALRAGLYIARIHDEVFELLPTDEFTPKDFSRAENE
ncbi:hypothetical protein ACFSUS_00580 [Spirosoma soli]|uniref:DUF3782 domain-containing protein n=1 Tax=Spirosoma soli TaxID=1770529 RepID=A0ABW5LWC9_9BACT